MKFFRMVLSIKSSDSTKKNTSGQSAHVVHQRAYRIWAYRKAAWTVDESPVSMLEIFQTRGEAGLRELPNIGKKLSRQIATWLKDDLAEVLQNGSGM